MRGRLLIFEAAVLLAGCGVKSQRTPEPNETDRVDQLVEQLGTDRTYNSHTLIMSPEPDGRVLMEWISRRKATLDGTLGKYQTPANNPGSISATLAWERDTERAESDAAAARRDACGEHPCPIDVPAPGEPGLESMDVLPGHATTYR